VAGAEKIYMCDEGAPQAVTRGKGVFTEGFGISRRGKAWQGVATRGKPWHRGAWSDALASRLRVAVGQ
jgi:hypothetical protein